MPKTKSKGKPVKNRLDKKKTYTAKEVEEIVHEERFNMEHQAYHDRLRHDAAADALLTATSYLFIGAGAMDMMRSPRLGLTIKRLFDAAGPAMVKFLPLVKATIEQGMRQATGQPATSDFEPPKTKKTRAKKSKAPASAAP